MPDILMRYQNIVANYGAINALNDVSIDISKGQIVTLIGANGAGKSSLLMSIYGKPKIIAGQVIFDGEDITGLASHKIARLGISQSPEGRRVFAGMTTEENLVLGTLPNTTKETVNSRLDDVYNLFPRLKERRTQRAGTMSGGEQQMLAIGRALMSDPKLLLLDEPSLGLAPIIVQQIFEVLKEIKNKGTTIFLVEQNANHALKLADKAYVLSNGKIQLEGTGLELLEDDSVKNAYLGH